MSEQTASETRALCVAGLQACGRDERTPAMAALNRHVRAVGIDAAADALVGAGFRAPRDPQWFSAALACNLLGVTP